MRLNFIPKTYLGKWSVGLIVVFFLSIALVLLFVASGRLVINLMIFAGICGMSSFFIGLISIIKNKERSILVFLATVAGLYILFLYLSEILSAIGILPSD